jgi:hypothetical protein
MKSAGVMPRRFCFAAALPTRRLDGVRHGVYSIRFVGGRKIMLLHFDAMEINHTPMSDVEGVLDSKAGTVCVAFDKKAKKILDYYLPVEHVVLGVQGATDVPVFVPEAKMESILVDDNDERLRAVFRFEPKGTTFKRPN